MAEESIISKYAEWCNSGEFPDDIYSTSIQSAKKLKLRSVSRNDIEQVVQPFLYGWGGMGRLLGQAKYASWRENLAGLVSEDAYLLQKYAKIDLIDANLSRERPNIEKLYSSFKETVWQVAATKCLHLFCPEFFPMWDNAIAKAAGYNDFSNEDYFQFVKQVQRLIVDNSTLISSLAKKYGKTKVKIVDDVLWWACNMPLSLIL